jgi:RNA polymerase-binding transcription factor DksA
MSKYEALAKTLKAQLSELIGRAEIIEDDLRHPLDADSEEQAVDLADDEALAGVDEVLRGEISAVRAALKRIDLGTYGVCTSCGADISENRLKVLPTATLCMDCA